jgi:hypothetical protein
MNWAMAFRMKFWGETAVAVATVEPKETDACLTQRLGTLHRASLRKL